MPGLNFFCPLVFILTLCFARDPPTVEIPNQGTIVGKEVSKSRIQRIIGYFGIPYAQPPVGDLRFMPPVIDPLPSWEGKRNATEYQPSCCQTKDDYKETEIPFLQLLSDVNLENLETSEDCLYLNVFVPVGSAPKQGFATIIWFHPGNFTTGSPVMWNPHTLVYRQRVIVVTVAFRLNIMGFFTTMDGEAPGNYGLYDQQAAMSWVKNNIQKFGGNPDNICLMGYGTGAVSIGVHMINQNSRDLFHKAIAMSGDFLSPTAIKYPSEEKSLLDALAKSFLCNRKPTSKFLECLRRLEANVLVQQTSNIDWRPLIDASLSNSTPPFVPEPPRNYFDRGDYYKVPFLTGYTNMEQVLEISSLNDSKLPSNITSDFLVQLLNDLISGDIPFINTTDSTCVYNFESVNDAVKFFYAPANPVKDVETLRKIIVSFITEKNYAASSYLQASYVSQEQPTFMYRFDMKPSTPLVTNHLPDWVSVPHLYDLIYVWGVPYWKTDQEWDIRDKRISDTIMSFWTNFAKSSNPTENSIYPIVWNAFTAENPGILIIDTTFNMSDPQNFNYKAFEFWNEYFPKVLDAASQCCIPTDSASLTYFQLSVSCLTAFYVVFSMLL